MKELSLEDLKRRLDVRGDLLGSQTDHIKVLMQKIHRLEKEIAEFKAHETAQEIQIFPQGDESLSLERLLADKLSFEELLEQRSQELLALTAKLDGLSSHKAKGQGGIEEFIENFLKQEHLKTSDQKIVRNVTQPQSPSESLDDGLQIKTLQTQLSEEQENLKSLETRFHTKEQEQKALREFLTRKDERITMLAAQVQELSGIRTQLEEERERQGVNQQKQQQVATESQGLRDHLTQKDEKIAELTIQAQAPVDLQSQLDKERTHRIDLETILNEQKQKHQKLVKEIQDLKDQLIKKDVTISEQPDQTQEPTELQSQLDQEQTRRLDLEKRILTHEQEKQTHITEVHELKDQLTMKDHNITELLAQVEIQNIPAKSKQIVDDTLLNQAKTSLKSLHLIKKKHETERQKFNKDMTQLQTELDAKSLEVTNLLAELERYKLAPPEVVTPAVPTLPPIRPEPELQITSPSPEYGEEILQEISTSPIDLVPIPMENQISESDDIDPGEWERLELHDIFESFNGYLANRPNEKGVISRLEVLRDIIFERKGGGMVVRTCGSEIQKLKRGASSIDSFRNVLRDMASSFGIFFS